MQEKELKTSPIQRFFIILIAVLMLGSMLAGYAAIIINNGNSSPTSTTESDVEIDEALVAEYEASYNKKLEEFKTATKPDFDKFIAYKSEIKAYNETSANESGLKTRDLKSGSGATVNTDGSNYLAYYVGFCADESVFDSSFDDNDNPQAFTKVLDPSLGMIEGWNAGIKDMKIGGVREITIPSDLAYKDSIEICGGLNKPLKFIVMAVAKEDPLKTLSDELDYEYMRYQYSQYGINYDDVLNQEAVEAPENS